MASSSSIHHFSAQAGVSSMAGSPKPVNDVSEILKRLEAPSTVSTAKSQERNKLLLLKGLESQSSLVISGIGDAGMSALTKALQQRPFPKLVKLSFLYNRLTQKSMWDFARAVGTGNLSNLQQLIVKMNHGIGDAGAKALAKALESGKLKRLQHLYLMNNNIGEQGLIALGDALETGHVSALQILHIGNENDDSRVFHNQGAKALAGAVRSNHLPHLEDLTLRGVAGEDGIIHLLKALECSKVGAFKQLDLKICEIGIRGAKALANTLRAPHFASLSLLDVQNNVMIGDEGIIALSTAFRSGNLKDLTFLYLDNVSMGEKGLLEIASLLEAGHLPSLQELYAGASEYTETSAKALVKAYKENTSLVAQIMVDWPSTSWGNQVESFRERNVQSLTVQHQLQPEIQGQTTP